MPTVTAPPPPLSTLSPPSPTLVWRLQETHDNLYMDPATCSAAVLLEVRDAEAAWEAVTDGP
jgi:hypothetical protein